MVEELQEAQIDSANAELNAPIGKIISDFESCLNNDLDVKTAFDSLYETISGLHKKRESLSAKNVKNLMSDLRQIDSVLQCIF
jgi:cysteinyl-tRNA synthetase